MRVSFGLGCGSLSPPGKGTVQVRESTAGRLTVTKFVAVNKTKRSPSAIQSECNISDVALSGCYT